MLALDNVPVSNPASLGRNDVAALRAEWEAGRPIRYTLLRGEQTLTVEVPPERWTLGA